VFIKIRKTIGVFAITTLLMTVMIAATAERVILVDGLEHDQISDQIVEFFIVLTTFSWVVMAIAAKIPLIQEKNSNRFVNVVSLLLFILAMYIARLAPEDGSIMVVNDTQQLILAIGFLIQPIIDFFELFTKVEEPV